MATLVHKESIVLVDWGTIIVKNIMRWSSDFVNPNQES